MTICHLMYITHYYLVLLNEPLLDRDFFERTKTLPHCPNMCVSVFFFSSRRRHTRYWRDWSSDVCSSDLYSTMSQIGYMFLGAGLATYGNAMFHLMTHAFFKALLFLAAGIVIHALVMEQDMRRMGGLRKLLPRTWVAMLIGALALSAIPPFSGFFSKDSLLASALDAGLYGQILWAVGLVGAFLTAVYTFRMIFIVFGGEPSGFVREHFHRPRMDEPNFWMAWTVGALAVLAVVGGWVQIAGIWHPLSDFLDHSAEPGVEPTGLQDLLTSVISVAASVGVIAVAWLLYSARRRRVPDARPARRALEEKLYWDRAYDVVF